MIGVHDITVRLDGAEALHGVTMALKGGDITGVIGPPEAGKTVLFKAVAGLFEVDSGHIEWNGVPVALGDPDSLRQWQLRIGMAFQNDALFDGQSVFDNVAFPLRQRKVPAAEVSQRVEQVLDDVHLLDASQRFPAELSGGMRKRVGIARAAVIEPEIALFDDPISGLDPQTGAHILAMIVGLTERLGMATAIISNDLPVLFPVCEEVVMLLRGKVVYRGHPDATAECEERVVAQFVTGSDEGPL